MISPEKARWKRPRLGLFSRFLGLFGLTTLALAFCIAAGVALISEDTARTFVEERSENFHSMLTSLLEEPIDMEKLKKKIKAPKVDILVVRDEEQFSTSGNFPPMYRLLENSEKIGDVYLAKYGWRYFLLVDESDGQVVVTSTLLSLVIFPNWLMGWPWLMALLVISLSYLILRRYMRPIADALKSAKMVSEGQFDYRIENHPKTELSDLTHGLNKMARDLQHLFDAKNDLLLAISHELRTPLARMGVSAAMLEEGEQATDIRNDIKQMDRLIEQLLEGERLEHGHKALHLNQYFIPTLIDEVTEEKDLKGKLALTNEVPETVLNIDVGRIKFLLRNLIRNAIQHAGDEPVISLKVSESEASVEFEVKDNGKGIPQDAIEHLFEPFFCVENTTHRDTKGTGLGLYLCQRIAQAHGGKVIVTSKLNQGSQFSLILPK